MPPRPSAARQRFPPTFRQLFHEIRRSSAHPRPPVPLPSPLQSAAARPFTTHARMALPQLDKATGLPTSDGLKLVNRLSESRSPYVRGHMNNPVAWQLWSPETIALARKHNRLIFVSIGYAACHWCHVMERESFENHEVADILNSSFIPVKIDREERPDVDRIYMNYVQATTGSGGWPLNVFITPELEPIFGGTYFPGPGSTMRGHVDFIGILEKIRDVWQNQQQRCLDSAKEITAQLREFAQEGQISRADGGEGDGLDLELLEESYGHFAKKFDSTHAGFGSAPKFPTPVNLSFLLRLGQYPKEVEDVVGEQECEHARKMVLETLRAMSRGGIHDQIGNGFARYSVTRDWSLPHFEKMLYDQAQLLPVYLDAYLITKDQEMLDTVYDIATYLTTPPMQSPNGGFFSSEDADSLYRPTDKEKREGAFYVWTYTEFQDILGDRDAEICAKYYNVQENGNVSPEHDMHDELINQNVLEINSTPEALAKEFGLSVDEVKRILREGRQKLLDHRNKERPRPSLDDKIVVGWNGLAIGALARTSSVVASLEPSKAKVYMDAAEKAVSFIQKELYDPSTKTLKRVYREGPGDAPAFADDYAFLISGLLDLYEATFNDAYLSWAEELQQTQIRLFWDATSHGFFSTAADASDLLLRLKDGLDNAEPSTNGVSAANLYRLSSLLASDISASSSSEPGSPLSPTTPAPGGTDYALLARQTCEAFEAEAMQHPFLFSSMMSSVVAGRLGVKSIVVCGEGEDVDAQVKRYREQVGGLRSLIRLDGKGVKSEWLRARNPLLRSMERGKKRVMICEGGACRETLDVSDLEKAVREMR